jgi:ribonucleoside-triphosphate reductase (thioredoxin)
VPKIKLGKEPMDSYTTIRELNLCFYKMELDPSFLEKYSTVTPPFGFNGLGELVYMRTYSRLKPNGENEKWFETIQRVVEGTYSIQKKQIENLHLGWNPDQAQRSAQEMYDRMFNMKFLPPGRGLWAMGSDIVNKKGLAASLNNCGFVSTVNMGLDDKFSKSFVWTMDMSMLGVGIGFDTKGAGNFVIQKQDNEHELYVVEDTREGWVKSTGMLIDSFNCGPRYIFDYSKIRLRGTPLKTFGGVSSGPQPLIDLHTQIEKVLVKNIETTITITTIVDIMNFIGKCVVAGNLRRTALISFGSKDSEEFMDLKDYAKNPQRMDYGWTSNNSIFADIGMDYSEVAKRICINGEPGIAWLDNMRKYSRMSDPPDNKDYRVMGGNPCLEQSLESYELCCLVESFLNRADSLDDFKRTLKFAYLYAKTVTLGLTHCPETNRVQLRNRRIGASVSGVAQFLAKYNLHTMNLWLDAGYQTIQEWDNIYSEWFCIPKSIKTTSVKPSGTVSLLAGATPGMHYPESRFYIRRMRLSNISPLVQGLRDAGYHIEPAVGSESDTLVVEIPIDVGEGIRTVSQVSMWEQVALAANMQSWWADNQVSCTVTFNPVTEGHQIASALDYFQYQLKGISFLPKCEYGAFPQMPYEEITEETFKIRCASLRQMSLCGNQDSTGEKFCDGDSCTRN